MLDAASITDLQSCPRRYLLSREWRPLRWRPKNLFDACLRQAAREVTCGVPTEKARANARSQFLQSAADPGLDIQGAVYQIAKEWATLLDVIVCALPRTGLPSNLYVPALAKLNSTTEWTLSSFMDDAHTLHRWVTVDHWSEADFRREVHGWWVAGDVAVRNTRLALHVIEIGQMRKGHRASDWVRAWRHPSIPHLAIKFRHTDGTPMRGWTPVRLVDSDYDVEKWVEQLWKEGVGQSLTRTITVEPPTESHRASVVRDVLVESLRMKRLEEESWQAQPMSRVACDGVVPCPYQDICYGGIVDIELSGLYVRRRQFSPAAASCATEELSAT